MHSLVQRPSRRRLAAIPAATDLRQMRMETTVTASPTRAAQESRFTRTTATGRLAPAVHEPADSSARSRLKTLTWDRFRALLDAAASTIRIARGGPRAPGPMSNDVVRDAASPKSSTWRGYRLSAVVVDSGDGLRGSSLLAQGLCRAAVPASANGGFLSQTRRRA